MLARFARLGFQSHPPLKKPRSPMSVRIGFLHIAFMLLDGFYGVSSDRAVLSWCVCLSSVRYKSVFY